MILLIIAKSSKLALILSATIPGGGQFYTENYFKGFIFLGAESYLFYKTYDFYNSYNDYKKLFLETGIDSFRIKRDIAQDNLYDFIWWDAVVYMLSLLDAFIDAELYNFEMDFKVKEKKAELNIIYKIR